MKIRTLTATLALAAGIGAVPASAAAPSLSTDSRTEGTPHAISVSHTCKVKKRCLYRVSTVDGTATAGTDYTAAEQTGKARKKHTFATTLTVDTIDDAACEPDETFIVHVEITNRKGTFGFDAPQTIVDNDCNPAQPTQPAPPNGSPVAVPANPQGTQELELPTPSSLTRICRTPLQAGTPAPASATLYRLDPCYVSVTCPATVAGCRASFEGKTLGEGPNPIYYVFGFSNGRVYNADGTEVDHIAAYCQDYGFCTATSAELPLKPGQTFVVDCAGSIDINRTRNGADRLPETQAQVACGVTVAWS